MKNKPEPSFVLVLRELAAVQAVVRRLETRVLGLMHDHHITDEEIGTVLNISSQAVGKRRRRSV